MIVYTALFINLMKKQLTFMSDPTISVIIKKIPRSIEKKIILSSSTKEIFENLKDYYEQRLRLCGYDEN